MGGFNVKNSIDTWNEAQNAEKIAQIVASASEYGAALLNERDLTAEPLLDGEDNDKDKVVDQVRATTDEKAEAFHKSVEGMPSGYGLERRLRLVEEAEPKLANLRKNAYKTSQDPVKTEEDYVDIEHYLLEFTNELGLGTGNVISYGRTVYAVALAKGAASLQRSIGMHLLVRPSEEQAVYNRQRVAFTSYAYLEGIAVQEYISGGTAQDAARLRTVMAQKTEEGKQQVAEAKRQAEAAGREFGAPPALNDMVQGVAARSPDELATQGITPATWMVASTAKFDGYDQIEADLIDSAVADADQVASDAQRDAIINGAIVIIALLTAFIITSLMARQMSRSMRQLRNAAFGVAEQRLPMLVDQLSRTDPGRVDTRVAPIPITSTDEIGEVARAFDQVHREAVRLAAEQALLRGNINAIFTNLSRRNQSLIEGQLTLITDLENNEADPDQLENLFKLDHLATRMRRNGENLLVLAGEEPGRRWDQPVPLVDVLRAASSEVEQYERIELSGVPEAEIHGRAVTDLVHLLAELLENATTFSSPQTKVRVTATRLPDGRVMIEIHDKGIGLTAEDFADINHKLANPPTVDAAISQRMGLFVVGRLSDRHGIRVQLRPSGEQAGTTSLVMLPDAITHGGGGDQNLQGDEFTFSQIIPEQQAFQGENFQGPPMRTAAELGFDDSRYDNAPDDIRELDPVGRSLMREERRAALETQSQQPELEAGNFREDYDRQQPGYDDGRSGYDNNQSGYETEQPAYDQQTAYEEQQRPTYDETYFPSNPSNGGYPEPSYAEPVQEEQPGAHGSPQNRFSPFEGQSYQDDWPQQDEYRNGYQSEYGPETESAQAADVAEQDRVGFDRPGPAPAAAHELTDAGLPRRGSPTNSASSRQPVSQEAPATSDTSGSNGTNGSGDWRSANDQRWQRAEQLKKPKAGGVTSSGLPRRVPKANLVEGTAESTHQGSPRVSRAPEDVRGRLSNLRRGVQRGRNAGSETNGQGFSPDSTYNQER